MHNAVLKSIDNHAGTARTYYFQTERQLRYEPGQFVELGLSHQAVDARGDKRWFTLSSSPSESLIAITTQINSENSSSFKRALMQIQSGDPVTISEAMGDFTLPLQPEIPLVFVTAGIGSTPMRSMVRYLIDNRESRDVTMHYIARAKQDVLFEDLFKTYCRDFKTHLTADLSGSDNSRQQSIRRDTEIFNASSNPEALVYISGPEQFVDSCYQALLSSGVSDQQLLRDYFHGFAA